MDKKDKNNQPVSADNPVSAENKDDNRRKLLKSVVAAGGAATVGKMLPENWARPVVDTVMLPSHAQTSTISPLGSFASSGLISSVEEEETQLADQGFSEELLEFFAPAAHAAGPSFSVLTLMRFTNNGSSGYLCATSNSSTQVTSCTVSGSTFTTTGCPHGFTVIDGKWMGDRWSVSLGAFNCSTTVDLFPSAGPDCSGPATLTNKCFPYYPPGGVCN